MLTGIFCLFGFIFLVAAVIIGFVAGVPWMSAWASYNEEQAEKFFERKRQGK